MWADAGLGGVISIDIKILLNFLDNQFTTFSLKQDGFSAFELVPLLPMY